jgi:protein ImuB
MFAAIHIPNSSAYSCQDLLALAQTFSPLIEETCPGTVILPVEGLRRLIGAPHQIASEISRRAAERGLTGNIGIAANPDTALLAARNLSGVTIIPKGSESKYIGEFKIETLPIAPETYEILDRWGIRTLEDFSALPDDGIHERLGAAAVHLLQLARGSVNRPLKPILHGTSYEERFELEYPVELLEPLLFILARLLNELCGRLDSHSMATTEIRLHLALERAAPNERRLQLPFATRDAKTLLKLLQHDLEAHPPGAPILVVTLAMTPVDPRVIQTGLFVPQAPEPEKLELTLTKIRSMVGVANVGSPELLDTHRPGAWKMGQTQVQLAYARGAEAAMARHRLAFRYFDPALKARVEITSGTPHRVFSQRIYGNVIHAAGPWRTSGDWWRDAWDRDEWDIGLNDGGLYRLCLLRPVKEWIVEGAYD